MPDLFFQCLFALLAIFGAVDLVRSVFLYAFRKSCPAGHYLMFSISGHDEQAELRLRCGNPGRLPGPRHGRRNTARLRAFLRRSSGGDPLYAGGI